MYTFWYNFDTVLYQFLKTGTSHKCLLCIVQALRFSGVSLYTHFIFPLQPLYRGLRLDSQWYYVHFYREEHTYTCNFTIFFLLHKSANHFHRRPQLNTINFPDKSMRIYPSFSVDTLKIEGSFR